MLELNIARCILLTTRIFRGYKRNCEIINNVSGQISVFKTCFSSVFRLVVFAYGTNSLPRVSLVVIGQGVNGVKKKKEEKRK